MAKKLKQHRWPHDCNRCVFIERHRSADWYMCPSSHPFVLASIVARYGERPEDYWSAPAQLLNQVSHGGYFLTKGRKIVEKLLG